MKSYPYTIDNGAGESLTFLRRLSGPEGEMLDVENCVQPGSGPPMHVHYFQEESLTVQQGRLGYQRPGEEPCYAGLGETVVFTPGLVHRFWNAGDEELRCKGFVRPPHNIEYFLSGIYESQRRNGGDRPDAFDAAYLAWRYRSEFGMDEIPVLVRRFIFPLQVALGHLLGKYKMTMHPKPSSPGPRPQDVGADLASVLGDRIWFCEFSTAAGH